ncbi:MAG: ribokinase [Bacilli bacterium]|nr:ribokinase [Bacilli bacterium]
MRPKIVIVGISGESIFLKTDHFHRSGETINAYEKHTEPGGKGYNQAAAAAKFGADVTFLTTVGDDFYGKYAVEYLENKGINVKYRIVKNVQTAYAVILTDKEGNNEVTVFSGASSYLTEQDVLSIEDEIKNADYILLQLEVKNEVLAKTLELAEKYNVKVVLNPAPARLGTNHSFYEKVDVLTPNEIELKDIYEVPSTLSYLEYGEYLKNIVKKTLIVTLGSNGCLLVQPNYYKYFHPLKVDVVDTTGAGDIFNAGLVTMLSFNKNIEEAIDFAIVSSALSVTKPYVMDAIPTLEEVNEKSGI